MTRNIGEHNIMIKGSIHQEDVAILNVYALNKAAKICEAKTDRTERKTRQIHITTSISPLSTTDRPAR